jgi:hypothetical protein
MESNIEKRKGEIPQCYSVHQEILGARHLSLYYSPKASAAHGNAIHFGHRHFAFTLVAVHQVI